MKELTVRQVESHHDSDVCFRGEQFVLGKSEYQTFQNLVRNGDSSLPQDQSEIETGGLEAARAQILDESVLQVTKEHCSRQRVATAPVQNASAKWQSMYIASETEK